MDFIPQPKLMFHQIVSRNASVILDVHNYARVQGRIIGEDKAGPSADSFASFWVQFARLWRHEHRVVSDS
jgi:hypothetical protein